MLKLIQFEFRKVFRSKYMYIIFGIGLALTLIAILMTKAMNSILEEIGESPIPYSGYYSGKSALGSSFSLFIGIFIGIFACEDFRQQTNKNIIAKGYNRISLFYSKYIVSLILSLGYAIILILTSLGLGYAVYGDGGMSIDDNVAVIFLTQLLCVIAYHAFFFFISYSIAKTGAAIAINIVAPMAASTLIAIFDIIINNPDFKIANFVIDGVLLNVSSTYTDTGLILPGALMLLAYIILSNGLGVFIASKKQF